MIEVIICGIIFIILCIWVYKKKSFIGAVLLYLILVALIAAMVNHSVDKPLIQNKIIKLKN